MDDQSLTVATDQKDWLRISIREGGRVLVINMHHNDSDRLSRITTLLWLVSAGTIIFPAITGVPFWYWIVGVPMCGMFFWLGWRINDSFAEQRNQASTSRLLRELDKQSHSRTVAVARHILSWTKRRSAGWFQDLRNSHLPELRTIAKGPSDDGEARAEFERADPNQPIRIRDKKGNEAWSARGRVAIRERDGFVEYTYRDAFMDQSDDMWGEDLLIIPFAGPRRRIVGLTFEDESLRDMGRLWTWWNAPGPPAPPIAPRLPRDA